MNIDKIEGIIEAMLFTHGDPLPVDKICDVLNIEKKTIERIITNMSDRYEKSNRGLQIRKIKDGYQLCTKQEYYEYISNIYIKHTDKKLSNAAFETLAIIAYNAPVTRAVIEKIRGVSSDSSISKLLERNLIKQAGRLEAPGRPLLYETTDEFLRCFGISTVDELPPVDTLINDGNEK